MTMPILRIGLIVGSLGFLYVTWASNQAGYPIEVALVRGVLAFMALSFVAYLGELVLATSPPVAARPQADAYAGADDNEPHDGASQTNGHAGDTAASASLLPVRSRSDNDELQAA